LTVPFVFAETPAVTLFAAPFLTPLISFVVLLTAFTPLSEGVFDLLPRSHYSTDLPLRLPYSADMVTRSQGVHLPPIMMSATPATMPKGTARLRLNYRD
jgi:hypothetical protein